MRLRVQERVWGNEYRTVLVCVDDFEDRILSGWICHPCLGEGRKVRGLMEFFKVVEDLLEQIRFPQSFTAKRAFGQAEPVFCREERDSAQGPPRKGKLGTFAVRILFRYHASWQGSVSWLEGGQEEPFRSALELALLIDSALEQTEKGENCEKRVPFSQSCGRRTE
ncbi:putative uncharacterized protein [Oscillibacter sp. CAG:155]|nr:putative uncharacterized protein [Oscillibacter sp. CAG:155]